MASVQMKSRMSESSKIEKTISVTEEILRGAFLYAPTHGLKQANTELKTSEE